MSKVILGNVPRRTKPNRTVRPPTQGTPGDVADESRTYSYNAGAGNPSHDWLIPNNVVAGDLIVVGICVFDLASGPPDVTPPAGYTSLVDLEETGNGVQDAHYYIYYRVADGTETDTTFTTDEDCRVVFMSNRIASRGGTLGTPVVGTVSTDASGNIDPNPVSPGTAGDYAVQVWLMHNNGSADPDNASAPPTGYTFVDYVTSEAVARRPRIYLCQGAFAITTSEDPGEVGWDGTVSFTLCRTFTVAVRLDAGSAPVATGDHTHTIAQATDVGQEATTKGDLLVFDGDSYERLAVGTNDQVLTADSAQTLGVKWADAAASGALDDLSDVTVTSVGDNEVLAYDNGSGEWINQTAAEAGLSAVGHSHTESDISDLDHWTESDHDALDHSGLTGVGAKELLMQDGVTSPPVPIENEAGDDWLYQD